MKIMKHFVVVTVLILVKCCIASVGDGSAFYIRCRAKCSDLHCEDDEVSFINEEAQPFHRKLMQWSCQDECQYKCMWETVDAFHKSGNPTPQFHGKWPFLRFFGIQEPASVLFSILNFYATATCLMRIRKEVRPDSPMYFLIHVFYGVCLNTWVWSTIFHIRDLPKTEFLDYAFAFALVLMNCYIMAMRLLNNLPRFILIVLTVFFGAFYLSHVTYLRMGKFDYAYNMQVNILVGCFTAIFWFAWCVYNRFRQPYVWKCALYVTLCSMITLLEVLDYPPLFYILDAHALWHLSSIPTIYVFCSFLVDDCKYLRKQMTITPAEKISPELSETKRNRRLSLPCFFLRCYCF